MLFSFQSIWRGRRVCILQPITNKWRNAVHPTKCGAPDVYHLISVQAAVSYNKIRIYTCLLKIFCQVWISLEYLNFFTTISYSSYY